MRDKPRQSYLTLGDSMNCNSPGSSVCGIFQARILEWVPFPSPRDLSDPGIKPESFMFFALVGGFFTCPPSEKPCRLIVGPSEKPCRLIVDTLIQDTDFWNTISLKSSLKP